MIRTKREWISFLTAGMLFSLNLVGWQNGAQVKGTLLVSVVVLVWVLILVLIVVLVVVVVVLVVAFVLFKVMVVVVLVVLDASFVCLFFLIQEYHC